MKRIQSILSTAVAKNTGWLIGAKVYQVLINLGVSVLTARYLGPANYGLIQYAASLCALFTAICTLGINDILVNELINNRDEQGKILGSVIGLRLITGGLSVLTLVILAKVLNPEEPLTVAVVFVYSTTLLLQSFDGIKSWYQSNLQNKVTAMISTIGYTVAAAYRIVLLLTHQTIVWFAAAHVVEFVLIAILLVITYYRRADSDQHLRFDGKTAREVLSRSYHFILSGLMVALYGQMDRIMLKTLLGETAVGYYSCAAAIVSMWPFVLAALIDSAKPVILAQYGVDRKVFDKQLTLLYGMIIYICMIVAAIITLLSKYIILILYGEAYLLAQGALCILCWSTAFSYLGVARSLWLIPQGKQKYEKYIALAGAICNCILNVWLIPVWGVKGAAVATLATQFVTNFVVGFFFRQVRQNHILILRSFGIWRYIQS